MKRKLRIYILTLTLALMAFSAQAQESEKMPMGFKAWKDKQILDARNAVVRASNKIRLLKSGQFTDEESVEAQLKAVSAGKAEKPEKEEVAENAELPEKETAEASESEESQPDSEKSVDLGPAIEKTEKALERALENLQFCKELSVEDYFAVYLNQFRDNPKALESVAEQMKAEEVSELLKLILKKRLDDQARGRPVSTPFIRGAETREASQAL